MPITEILMVVGFLLAAYAVVANDSIQTLGTFLASNAQRPWWQLWIFASSILVAVLLYGWWVNSGDPAYGRLEEVSAALRRGHHHPRAGALYAAGADPLRYPGEHHLPGALRIRPRQHSIDAGQIADRLRGGLCGRHPGLPVCGHSGDCLLPPDPGSGDAGCTGWPFSGSPRRFSGASG